ncbi:hypothetical protein [Calothrix sp. CCY 0018]|uniref:hypothetical protein n=1 Tax=Calothrix sp. CCY 0018 TaxID=3103864 RepID=UPI0039C5E98A
MSDYLADLKNDNNWQQVYTDSKTVLYDAAGGYRPLPVFEIPITFDSPLLIIRTLSDGAKFTWRFSGVLSQRISMSNVASPVPTAALNYNRLRINRSSLLHFPRYNTDYELIFEPYTWIKNINLAIWSYSGVFTNELFAQVEEVRDNELSRIESKIDTIING